MIRASRVPGWIVSAYLLSLKRSKRQSPLFAGDHYSSAYTIRLLIARKSCEVVYNSEMTERA